MAERGCIMLNPIQIEEAYQTFTADLPRWIHDGVLNIDLQFLHDADLLHTLQGPQQDPDDLSQYFHVVESIEKVTLFNEQFIVWIVPDLESEDPMTLVMIALNQPNTANLEIVFTTSGVYNTPNYVLQALQHFLLDMMETEETMSALEKSI